MDRLRNLVATTLLRVILTRSLRIGLPVKAMAHCKLKTTKGRQKLSFLALKVQMIWKTAERLQLLQLNKIITRPCSSAGNILPKQEQCRVAHLLWEIIKYPCLAKK